MIEDRLNESHREALRHLVKLSREGAIADEFYLIFSMMNAAVIIDRAQGQHIEIPRLTRLATEALTRSGYLFSLPTMQRAKSGTTERESEAGRSCYITPAGFRAVDTNFAPFEDLIQRRAPNEITASLAAFREDFPDPTRLAFVMMEFGSTPAHAGILKGIRAALDPYSFTMLRADEKQYHDSLYFNVLTYIYGCRFGIAVFERIENDTFNPNVSLEVGYLLGIDRPVCFLKDRTVRTLQTDLLGLLYKEFDPLECEATIPTALWKWMEDKAIVARRATVENKS